MKSYFFVCRALRVRRKMATQGVIHMIGDILCENVSCSLTEAFSETANLLFLSASYLSSISSRWPAWLFPTWRYSCQTWRCTSGTARASWRRVKFCNGRRSRISSLRSFTASASPTLGRTACRSARFSWSPRNGSRGTRSFSKMCVPREIILDIW